MNQIDKKENKSKWINQNMKFKKEKSNKKF